MWSSRWSCRGFILGAGAPLGTVQNIGIGCGEGCSTGLVCGLITYVCSKKYIVLENEEESEVPSSEGGNRGVITAQPQPLESSGLSSSHAGDSGGKFYETACLVQGYNLDGQLSSLLDMQYVLMGSSENVLTLLKFLALKAH